MWKAVLVKEPLIIDPKDWSTEEFKTICKIFDLDANTTGQIVLRERYTYEYNEKE